VCALDEVQTQVRELTGGEGADIVIEATGSEEVLAIAASLCRVEGTLAIVGYHQGSGRQVPLHEWNWKALQIVNAHVRSPHVILDGAARGLQLLAAEQLVVQPLITHRFPLSGLQAAFAAAAARTGGLIKAVVEPEAER
jgi:threonine dehydrogenase-like Zn-dependent dehydrogenase